MHADVRVVQMLRKRTRKPGMGMGIGMGIGMERWEVAVVRIDDIDTSRLLLLLS